MRAVFQYPPRGSALAEWIPCIICRAASIFTMKKNHILHIIVAGIALGACSAAALAAGTEAAEAAAETESAVSTVLHSIADILPFPWNIVAASVLTAAGAVWAWRRKQQATDNG